MTKHNTIAAAALIAVLALIGIAMPSTSAFALPDVSITLAGSAYPLHLNYTSPTVETVFEEASGGHLKTVGLTLLLLTGELTALGTFRADFTNFTFWTSLHKCNSPSDATGVVLMQGSFHVVYTNLSPLLMGVLYLPKEVEVSCEGFNFNLRGSVITSLNAEGTDTTELTNVSGALLKGATAGSQQISEYYNDAGTKLVAKLESNASATFLKTNLQILNTVPLLTALSPNMFVITSR